MMKPPLLSPKHISDYTPEEYMDYVKSLYIDPKAGKPIPREFNATRTKKGTITIRIKRDPKYITRAEIIILAAELKIPQSEMFLLIKKRKIEVK